MDEKYAGLCENVNNFSKDGIFVSDRNIETGECKNF
jgi:hypothetical protein